LGRAITAKIRDVAKPGAANSPTNLEEALDRKNGGCGSEDDQERRTEAVGVEGKVLGD
jgi:hypothetical protein